MKNKILLTLLLLSPSAIIAESNQTTTQSNSKNYLNVSSIGIIEKQLEELIKKRTELLKKKIPLDSEIIETIQITNHSEKIKELNTTKNEKTVSLHTQIEEELKAFTAKRKKLLHKQTKADSELVYSLSEQTVQATEIVSENPNNKNRSPIKSVLDSTATNALAPSIVFIDKTNSASLKQSSPIDQDTLLSIFSSKKEKVIKPSTSLSLNQLLSDEKTPLNTSRHANNPPIKKKRPLGFYEKLVKEALIRTQYRVKYDGRYRYIKYPWGDVPSSIGVCTDVIIRSYRKLGIDLQQLVHHDISRNFNLYPSRSRWGLSRPDPNIDHRRVYNLQVFFNRFGQSLPITQRASDYKAGDLVTWQLGPKLPHIGVVVNKPSPFNKQRLMVVHNIGRGPQLEDILFSFPITGHYRYKPSRILPRNIEPIIAQPDSRPNKVQLATLKPSNLTKPRYTLFTQQAYSLLNNKSTHSATTKRTHYSQKNDLKGFVQQADALLKTNQKNTQRIHTKQSNERSHFNRQAQHLLFKSIRSRKKPKMIKTIRHNRIINSDAAMMLLNTPSPTPKKLSDIDKAMLRLSQ